MRFARKAWTDGSGCKFQCERAKTERFAWLEIEDESMPETPILLAFHDSTRLAVG
jgi:hypothetical protein